MDYKIIYNKKFKKRLSEVLIYLEKEWGKKVADDFLINIVSKINSLQHHSHIGALTKVKDIRGIGITEHNRLFYRIKGNNVIILNLYDTRRKSYSKYVKLFHSHELHQPHKTTHRLPHRQPRAGRQDDGYYPKTNV